MEKQRIEYIRRNYTKKRNPDDPNAKKKRSRGKKKGVLFCGIDPELPNSVIMGFSLCHPTDKFDYIQNQRVEGFGLETAKSRAEKWKFHKGYFVQNTFTEDQIFDDDAEKLLMIVNPDPTEVVEIPASVHKRLVTFIERCEKYYKDKLFPVWVGMVKKGVEIKDFDSVNVIHKYDEKRHELELKMKQLEEELYNL